MISCVSLFSGAGGLDVGVRRAGAQIAVCIENDHDAVETLKFNHAAFGTEILERDIREVDLSQWYGNVDSILVGGPPCQPFSKNGYWVKNNNRLIEYDPRNMLGQFIRGLKVISPKGFLFENVESILHPTNIDSFDEFLYSAEKLGYKCTVYVANAADFGVPQKRKRVFVFGVKKIKYKIPTPTPTHANYDKKSEAGDLLPHTGVGDFILKYDSPQFSEREEDAKHGTYYHELTSVPPGNNYIALSNLNNYHGKTFKAGGRFWNFLYKLHPDKPSITIAAQPGPWVGPFHWSNRRLRVPEIAAIQTFPEEYRFFGNRRSIQKQIGNAAPCLLAEKMVTHLIGHLK